MKIKLNGWQRIWIVMTIIYSIIVLLISYNHLPNKQIANIDYHYFVSSLPENLRNNLNSPDKDYEQGLGYKFNFDLIGSEIVIMKNGDKLYFKSGTKKEIIDNISNEYNIRIESLMQRQNVEYYSYTLMFLIFPPIVIYLLGWSVGWVIRGFRNEAS